MSDTLKERLIEAAKAADEATGGGYLLDLRISPRGVVIEGHSRADRHARQIVGWDDIEQARVNPILLLLAGVREDLEPPRPAPGPAFEGWADLENARRDIAGQAHKIRLAGGAPVDLAMNDATRDLLFSLAGTENFIISRGPKETLYPESFMGLPIVIDETVGTPTVRGAIR
jgi:hypothetical protein